MSRIVCAAIPGEIATRINIVIEVRRTAFCNKEIRDAITTVWNAISMTQFVWRLTSNSLNHDLRHLICRQLLRLLVVEFDFTGSNKKG
jgi:hypothetical protein